MNNENNSVQEQNDAFKIMERLREWREIEEGGGQECYLPPGFSGIFDYGRGILRFSLRDNPTHETLGNIKSIDDSGATFYGTDKGKFHVLANKWQKDGFPTAEEMIEECRKIGVYVDFW